jgi:uncharacterized cupin superfamily protein
VEIIDERDYLWHPSELIRGEGDARQRNLAYDEEDGSVSTSTWFVSDWGRPAGIHHAETEWYVLEGEVRLGDEVLRAGGYFMAPTGVWAPELTVAAGTRVLIFREYGDWGFDVAAHGPATTVDGRGLVVRHSAQMPWIPVEIGSPMRFDLGGSPVPGLFIKLLYRNPATGFYTRLIKAQAGWTEHPLAHHPCFEEAYCLEGGFQYNYGEMWPGTYFFRPALIRHGDFTAALDMGCTWIVRSDSDLVDWYTEDSRVEMHGTAVNWGSEFPGTAAPRLLQPVRSRSLGEWKDPSYQ